VPDTSSRIVTVPRRGVLIDVSHRRVRHLVMAAEVSAVEVSDTS
jgi:hypothetical protein